MGGSAKKEDKKAAKPEKKKEEKPKPKKEVEEPEELDAAEQALLEEPKSKDPFDEMPKGTFNMDDFKRFYSNNEEAKSIPYFWEKFDKENYSIWYGEYKYSEELTKVFMSCNLITGEYSDPCIRSKVFGVRFQKFWRNYRGENILVEQAPRHFYCTVLEHIFKFLGMYQRLDKMRKQCFASVCLFGTDNDSTISGIWVWRGQNLAFEVSVNCCRCLS